MSRPSFHLPVLDGWRAVSILCVLAGHMLPLGPKWLELNAAVAATGMSLFFILSGFLIVSMLARDDSIAPFLVRRAFRIIPLAWAYLAVVLLTHSADWEIWKANLLFYANFSEYYLQYAPHFWSLCVEMQFYVAIALAVGFFGRRGLSLVPICCIAVTVARVISGQEISIETWFRVDEILAGGCLALVVHSRRASPFLAYFPGTSPFFLAPVLLLSSHTAMGALNYGRPYFAALLIGSTIASSDGLLQKLLRGKPLAYLARVSFAVYVIHPLTYSGWMGAGDVFVRYTKRLGSFFLTFLFAHFSTSYYERYWNDLGHRLAGRIAGRQSSKPREIRV